MDKWKCRGSHRDGGMTPWNGQVGVSLVSPGWWNDADEWTSGGVVDVTRMVGRHLGMDKLECRGSHQDGGATLRSGQVGVLLLSQ
ncbi:hypothetical protein LSAT2_017945, partial [Lamellibrachia satsuma]